MDFNESLLPGVMLRPNPTQTLTIDLRQLLDAGIEPQDKKITVEMDNSVNAFRRLVLRRGQGSERTTSKMSSEDEVRAVQAEMTWKWLVSDQGKQRFQDTTTCSSSFI